MRHRVGLIWFQNDLRVDDHRVLSQAASECDQLICWFPVNPQWFIPNRYGMRSIGSARWLFLHESLRQLDLALRQRGNRLLVTYEPPLQALAELISRGHVDVVYRSRNAGFYENQYWQLAQQRYPYLTFTEDDTHTLFDQAQLPFQLQQLPESFSKFRRLVEQPDLRVTIRPPLDAPKQLPTAPLRASDWRYYDAKPLAPLLPVEQPVVQGGCDAALTHVSSYFRHRHASTYKETRNALDDWTASTKFSPWLANGSLSVRRLNQRLHTYEREHGANDSTYWIYFELLWREYFQWYAHTHKQHLYRFQGIKAQRPTTSFYGGRLQKWCQGNTPYPIVNACMKQLNATGYMSNRGRQLVASCFVHELQLDWRYGAAYFEQQLVDYDVGANWGNWQYLAGVGADPRGHRQFDLGKQTRQYDPDGTFIERWHGEADDGPLDHIDAADWPIKD